MLVEFIGGVVADAELDEALRPLLERGFIERFTVPEPPPELDPFDRPLPRFRTPFEPEPGDEVYRNPSTRSVRRTLDSA